MGEEITTIAIPKRLKRELDRLKLSKSQSNYEVIEALIAFFKAKGGTKTKLWTVYEEAGIQK